MMILYRIQRKDTGQFFGGFNYPWSVEFGHEGWNEKGNFYSNIETIRDYLKVLSCDWKRYRKIKDHGRWYVKKMAKKLNDVDFDKMKNLEVIINDISIKGTNKIPAIDFFKDAINDK